MFWRSHKGSLWDWIPPCTLSLQLCPSCAGALLTFETRQVRVPQRVVALCAVGICANTELGTLDPLCCNSERDKLMGWLLHEAAPMGRMGCCSISQELAELLPIRMRLSCSPQLVASCSGCSLLPAVVCAAIPLLCPQVLASALLLLSSVRST